MERTEATGYRIYTDTSGKCHFFNDNDDMILSEDISGQTIYWDENDGYVLADGRNMRDLVITRPSDADLIIACIHHCAALHSSSAGELCPDITEAVARDLITVVQTMLKGD